MRDSVVQCGPDSLRPFRFFAVRAVDEDDAVTFVPKGSDAVPNGEECFRGDGHR